MSCVGPMATAPAQYSCAESKPITHSHDPYFFPLYEEASRLNLPIGIHSGIGNFTVNEILNGEPFRVAKLIVIGGFHSMILNGITERFPKLRIGAIEVAAHIGTKTVSGFPGAVVETEFNERGGHLLYKPFENYLPQLRAFWEPLANFAEWYL